MMNITLFTDHELTKFEGILGLNHLEFNSNVVQFRQIDMAIIVTKNNDYPEEITRISKNSDICILCIQSGEHKVDIGNDDIDIVVPYSTEDELYWIIRGIVEPIANPKNIIGVDLCDLRYIIKNKYADKSFVIDSIDKLPNIDDSNADGVLLTIFSPTPTISLIEAASNRIKQLTNSDIPIVQSLILDEGIEGDKIVVILLS